VDRHLLTIAVVIFVLAPAATGEQIAFRDAVTLALKNAKVLTVSEAETLRARKAYLEARNAYVPQITLGSGAGYSFGFPLGQPSIFNVTAGGVLWNPAQREYVRAANFGIHASEASLQDRRQQVILETAVTYADLDRHLAALDLLQSEQDSAARALSIAQQRIQSGLEPAVEETRAKLNLARVHLKYTQVVGETDALRLRLSQLTGVSAVGLSTISDSLPTLPPTPITESSTAIANDTQAVRAARIDAESKDHLAAAERNQLKPQVSLATQYALFSNSLNNYSSYYRQFSSNNAGLGVEIRIPLLNFSQRAKYGEAQADAQKAHAQADDTRDLIANEIARLQHVSQQAAQAQEIAELDFQLAQSDTAAVSTQLETGQRSPKDLQNAQLAEADKRAAMLDARFNYQQARLQLLRLTGEIEGWAKAGGSPAP
jgi:outer membrane protein TolC